VVVDIWTGMFAPKGTPPEIVSKLNREIDAILRLPDVKKKLEGVGQIIEGGSPDVLAQQVKHDTAVFTPIVASAHIAAQ
jgi:tripartite-type tricarboxylate transporter receptor subunit TctC